MLSNILKYFFANKKNMNYRPEIDGLRALAVLSVILYHAKINFRGHHLFEGGFLGVDIFFVISGYLITKIILQELFKNNSFNFFNFYERRARRILPLLFAVILVSVPFAWNTFLPNDFVEYSQSIISSLFFISNFFFYYISIDYGAEIALYKPFIHTWSLSIEEQFYIFFPIVLVFIFKHFKVNIIQSFFVMFFLSFCYAIYASNISHNLNFYFPFSRFWEIIIGSILAYFHINFKKKVSMVNQNLFSIFGLSLIFFSIFYFDDDPNNLNFKIFLCISGVGLVIFFSSYHNISKYILCSKPLIFLGLISYSMYLWHFPVMAYARFNGDGQSNYDKLLWIITIFFLSTISYFLIEKPFRNNLKIKSSKFWKLLSSFFIIIILMTTYIIYEQGFKNRFMKNDYNYLKYFDKPEYEALEDNDGNCRLREVINSCRLGNEKIVFLGDSYVGHFQRATINKLFDYNLGYISFAYEACPFVKGNIWFGNQTKCPSINRDRKKEIINFKDKKIFIISVNETQFEDGKITLSNIKTDRINSIKQFKHINANLVWNAYIDKIKWIASLGHKVIVISSIPKPPLFDSKRWLINNKHFIKNLDFPDIYNHLKPSVIQSIDKKRFSILKNPNIKVLNPSEELCNEIKDACMDVIKNIGPVYNGGRHLSYPAAHLIAWKIKNFLIKNNWIKPL